MTVSRCTGPPASTQAGSTAGPARAGRLAAAGRLTRQQQVGCQTQQLVWGLREQAGVDPAEVRRCRQRWVAQEVSYDPVLQKCQGPVGLLRRQEVAGGAPGVTG